MIEIRLEQEGDIEKIRVVNDIAFGQQEDGFIVDRLRENCDEILSCVASVAGKIVGHILFSPVPDAPQ
jgi:putative acetyltransferase